MNKAFFSLLFSILLGNIPHALAADESPSEQLNQIETMQRRAEKLTFPELNTNNYHLAKARTWLDLALSEYYDKDTSGVVFAAISQAETLLDALEKKLSGITMDTPLQVKGSEAVRPDLLDQITVLKKNRKFPCGQRQIAAAEVHLVWAGHEFSESGKSHAEPYERGIENLIYEAQVAIDNCMTVAPAPALEKITLSSDALFAFGQSTLNPSALSRLDGLVQSIKMTDRLEEVLLVGHTDHLRSDGHQEHNQLLSEQRAESIKQYLIGKGIEADKLHTRGAGSAEPVVKCSARLSKDKQIACLQPNRRVEITLRGGKTVGDKKESVK